MVKNNPRLTNQEAFLKHFYTWMEHPHEKVWPLVDHFTNKYFPLYKATAVLFLKLPIYSLILLNLILNLYLPPILFFRVQPLYIA